MATQVKHLHTNLTDTDGGIQLCIHSKAASQVHESSTPGISKQQLRRQLLALALMITHHILEDSTNQAPASMVVTPL